MKIDIQKKCFWNFFFSYLEGKNDSSQYSNLKHIYFIIFLKDDFWKNTNIVGLSNAADAKSVPRKLFWIFIFLGFLAWFVSEICTFPIR